MDCDADDADENAEDDDEGGVDMFCALTETPKPVSLSSKFDALAEDDEPTFTEPVGSNDLDFLNGFAHKIQVSKKLSSGTKKTKTGSNQGVHVKSIQELDRPDIAMMIRPLAKDKADDRVAKLCPTGQENFGRTSCGLWLTLDQRSMGWMRRSSQTTPI